MLTTLCTTNILSKPRTAWAREGGAKRRYSTARVRAALQRRRRAGWLTAQPADGPRHERVTLVHPAHPLAFLHREWAAGVRLFECQRLERAIGRPLNCRATADDLAEVGFALVRVVGTQVELRPADPRTAHLVNRSRLKPAMGERQVRRVLAAVLSLPPKGLRQRRVTEERRRQAAEWLQQEWLIDGVDLLDCRPRARLRSFWLLAPGAPRASAFA